MADLMTDTFDYDTLANQYGNFRVPLVKVKASGTDVLTSIDADLYEMSIVLSVKACSTVVLKLDGAYEESSHSFDSDVIDTFQPGTIFEVELGYQSHSECVFKGYVSMLGAEFEEKRLLVVTMMDARRLMMTSGKKHELYEVSNYSDAFTAIMDNYSSLVSTTVDATEDNLMIPLSQTSSDYEFVTRELVRKANREFFIFGENAYFRTPRSNTSAALTLKYGRELISLKADFSYLNLSVALFGYDNTSQTAVSYTESVLGVLTQSTIGSVPTAAIIDEDANTQDKAQSRAKAFAQAELGRACSGHGICIGLPELVPGRFVKVEELDTMLNQTYYMEEVTHEITQESFQTYFEIGGCLS